MSVKTVAVSAVLMAGLLVPASAVAGPATTAAKKQSVAAQLKALKAQVKKNTATGKSNTSKIKSASKAVATTFAGVNKSIDAANARTTAVDGKVNSLDGKVNAVVATAVDALTKLQAGLVQVGDGLKALAASYGNFEYGTVQLYAGSDLQAGQFLATPRLDPTVEQATVTGQFACIASVIPATTGCDSGDVLHAKVAVRSANPTANDATSKVYCRVTASQTTGGAVSNRFVTSTPNTAFPGAVSPNFPPAYPVVRSPLVPTDPAELAAGAFPLSPATTDVQVDLTTSANSAGVSSAGPNAGGFALAPSGATAGMINVTLSCLTVPNPA